MAKLPTTATEDDPLAGIAAQDAPLLTPEEIEAARAEARERVRTKKVKEAKAAIIAAEIAALEREEGQRTGIADMDEEVPIYIDLPEFTPSVKINGEPFWHGQTYVRPRHVVNSLREQMFRAWEHQRDIEGQSMTQKIGQRRVRDPQTFSKGPTSDPRFTVSAGQGAAA